MSLIEEIRNDILDRSIPLTSILRKATILAHKLKSEELKKWINQELGGYSCKFEELPDYRRNKTYSLGNLTNGFWALNKTPLPIHLINDEEIREFARNAPLNGSISALESLLGSSETSFCIHWESALLSYVNGSGCLGNGFHCIDAWRVIGRGHVEHVLDSVRSRLLNFVLEIEEMVPDANDIPSLKRIPPAATEQAVRTTIYGNNNVVASGHHIDQMVEMNIKQGDIGALTANLEKSGVEDSDIKELMEAIEADGSRPAQKSYGARVAAWVGGVTQKMLSGTGQLVIATAPGLIDSALSHYYGWK